jgi:hypothetical protein
VGAPQPGDWTNTDELLAGLLELTHSATVLQMRIHSKEGAAMPKPLVIPRPHRTGEETRRRGSTIGDLKKLFGARGAVAYTPKDRDV